MASELWLHQAMQELGENGKEHILGLYILPISDSFLIFGGGMGLIWVAKIYKITYYFNI